jgi:CRISPR-associated exonuclease Cas4
MPLALLLVLAIVLYLVIAGVSRRERAGLGLSDGQVVLSADDTRAGAPTLYSERLGLVGRPDHLLEWDGVLIPVEQKPRSRRLQPSHVPQVAAQCVLVEEVYGVRPPYGVVALAGGIRGQVVFTPALERSLLTIIGQMRAVGEGRRAGPALGGAEVPGVWLSGSLLLVTNERVRCAPQGVDPAGHAHAHLACTAVPPLTHAWRQAPPGSPLTEAGS